MHASVLPFPAATTKVTPEAIDSETAALMLDDTELVPRLMFATAGLIALAVTHSMPLITWAVVPLPLQARTRTDTSVTFLATP